MRVKIKLKLSTAAVAGNKVAAIKELRIMTGMGLKEALDTVKDISENGIDTVFVDMISSVNPNSLDFFKVVDEKSSQVDALKNLVKDCIDSGNFTLAADLLAVLRNQ